MEVPVKRILLGQAIDRAANVGSMANPGALQFFVDLASRLG